MLEKRNEQMKKEVGEGPKRKKKQKKINCLDKNQPLSGQIKTKKTLTQYQNNLGSTSFTTLNSTIN